MTPTATVEVEETAPQRPDRRQAGQRRGVPAGLLRRGGLSFVVATTAVAGLNFVFHLLISRLLGPSYYGALGAVLNVISVLAVPLGAVQLAVTQAVANSASRERASLGRLTIKAMLWGLAAMVAVWVLSPLVDGFLNLQSPLADLAIGLWVPLAVVAAVLQGALLAELRFAPVAIATFLGGGVLRLVSGALLVSAGFGLAGAVAATVIGQVFTTATLMLVARREVFAKGCDPVRISLRDAVLSIAALAGYTTLTGIDVFLARHFLAPVTAGRYAAGAIAGHIALFLPGALVTVAFPRLVSANASGTSTRKTLTETLGLVTVIGLAAFLVLAGVPGLVVDLLFGPKYLAAASIVGIIALISVLLGVIGLLTYFHIARRSVAALISWAGVALVWALVTVLHGGMETIADCMLAASVLVLAAVSVPTLAAILRPVAGAAASAGDTFEFPPAEIDVTLVIPFYNPGHRLPCHVQAVVDALRAEQVTFEVIAVSDGSTDGSPASITGIDQVRIIELAENQGKGTALRVGLAQGRGRYLGFIDGDGDIPAQQISHFLAATRAGDPDVVIGSKLHPASDVIYPPLRRLYSSGYRQLTRLLFQLPTRDTQTGIKLIRRETLAAVLPKMVEKRFAFDLELLVVARRMGYRNFIELPVQIAERFTTTISLRAVWRIIIDTAAIFYRLRIVRFYGPRRASAFRHSQVGLDDLSVGVPYQRTALAADENEHVMLSGEADRSDLLVRAGSAFRVDHKQFDRGVPGQMRGRRGEGLAQQEAGHGSSIGQDRVPAQRRVERVGTRPLAAGDLVGSLTDSGHADRRLRILAYNWRDLAHPRAGGAEVYLHSVAREWVRCGHEVTIFCASVDDRPSREIADGVEVIRRGGRLGVYREARRYWHREGDGRFDLVVDCVNTRPFLCPRFVRNVPVVAVIHQVAREIWRYETPWPISVLGRYLLEPAWLQAYRDVPVVTVSESSRESLVEYGLRRITVVPEGWVAA